MNYTILYISRHKALRCVEGWRLTKGLSQEHGMVLVWTPAVTTAHTHPVGVWAGRVPDNGNTFSVNIVGLPAPGRISLRTWSEPSLMLFCCINRWERCSGLNGANYPWHSPHYTPRHLWISYWRRVLICVSFVVFGITHTHISLFSSVFVRYSVPIDWCNKTISGTAPSLYVTFLGFCYKFLHATLYH